MGNPFTSSMHEKATLSSVTKGNAKENGPAEKKNLVGRSVGEIVQQPT